MKRLTLFIFMVSLSTTAVKAQDDVIIDFDDAYVKALCVDNWDTNEDGELSIAEAAAVTDLGDVFRENWDITSFNELMYFTGLTDLGQAFETCTNLTSIIIPSAVENIGPWGSLWSMESIQVDINNPWFDSRDNCNAIIQTATNTLIVGCKATVIPDDVTAIAEDAFGGRTGLRAITIPSSVTSIGTHAFCWCSNLPYIAIPSSVTEIGQEAFAYSHLTAVKVEWEEPLAVPDDIFNAIPDISKSTLIVPVGTKAAYEAADVWKEFGNIVENVGIEFEDALVKQICVANWDTDGDGELSYAEAAQVGEYDMGEAFRGSNITKFNELRYFTALDWIPDNAFNTCKYLTSVVLPPFIGGIGLNAFYGNYKLTSVELPEGMDKICTNAFYACTVLPEITIPNSVTEIGDKAFYYCKKLASVELPASLTTMGKSVFSACSVLRDVVANMPEPVAITSGVFPNSTYSEGTLHVPAGKAQLYREADYWKNFLNIEEFIVPGIVMAGQGSVHKGGVGCLDIRMDNTEGLVAMQTEVELPEDFSVEYMELNGGNGHSVSYNNIGGNNYRITVFSLNNSQMVPIEDNIYLRIRVQAPVDAEPAVYAFARNNVLVDGNGERTLFNDFTMEIEVLDNRMGDVNGDDVVDVVDVVHINNHIMGYEQTYFVEEVADMNGDQVIDVADIVEVVMVILTETPDPLVIGTLAPAANNVQLVLGDGETMTVSTENAERYCALQMDITLGEGMTLRGATSDGAHAVALRQTGANTYRIIAYSPGNSGFSGLGGMLSLDIEGEGDVTVSRGILVTAEGEGFRATAAQGGHATGINGIAGAENRKADVYTTAGQRMDSQQLPPGIYIVNGKKMVVK